MVLPKTKLHADVLSQSTEHCAKNKNQNIPLPMPEDYGRDQEYGVDHCYGFIDEENRDETIDQYEPTERGEKDFPGKLLIRPQCPYDGHCTERNPAKKAKQ